jgi:transcriptional antiterminator NusG
MDNRLKGSAMQNWYVVQVISGHEKKVKKTLEENRAKAQMTDLITDVLIPTENVSEVVSGEQKVTEKKLWPGYLFVKMELTDESFLYIKHTQGVLSFLGGETPVALTEGEASQILTTLEERKKGVVQKHKFEVGDTVKITDGVFINFLGTVVEVFHDKGRLSVRVSIFGRDTRVDDLEFWQVEKVTSESES